MINDDDTQRWSKISHDYLLENFISDEGNNNAVFIDMDKIGFQKTALDRHYYKKHFPKFDDSTCIILEKCSIKKEQEERQRLEFAASYKTARDFIISLD